MDNKLRCGAAHCVHNLSGRCGAAVVKVRGGTTQAGENTFCSTYADRSPVHFFTAATNVNLVGGLKQLFSGEQALDPQIACTAANCAHNADQYCQAERVKINGPSSTTPEETECETFRPR